VVAERQAFRQDQRAARQPAPVQFAALEFVEVTARRASAQLGPVGEREQPLDHLP
jgi:hypothetical protein